MARVLRVAIKGPDAAETEPSCEEEVGFMVIADAIQCLRHLREAYSAKK